MTQLPYQELYDWDGAAEFVADYLNFLPLDPPYEIVRKNKDYLHVTEDSFHMTDFDLIASVFSLQPKRLLSSMTCIRRQLGNCFEYATLLCSLLLGSGYDAYVVSGYATRETCMMDESREICPLLRKKEQVGIV